MLRFLRTIRHIPPLRLLERARFIARRKFEIGYNIQLPDAAHITFNPLKSPHFNIPEVELNKDPTGWSLTIHNETFHSKTDIPWNLDKASSGAELKRLSVHYLDSLYRVSDKNFEELFFDWKRRHPLKPHCSWSPYAASMRATNIAFNFSSRTALHNNERLKEKILLSLHQHCQFISKNLERDICGNHIIKNIKALIVCSRCLICEQSEGWYEIATEELKKELPKQILADGMHFELSPCYHWQVLTDLLEIYSLLTIEDQDFVFSYIHSMYRAGIELIHPDGKLSHFSDGTLKTAFDINAARQFALLILGEDEQHSNHTFCLQNAGYAGMHTNDGDCFIYDFGQPVAESLPAHGHADIFSFEWSINKERFFVDPGVYEYSASAVRTANRSSLSHNTLSIAGQSQCEMYNSFRVGRRAKTTVKQLEITDTSLKIQAEHDGYKHLPGTPIHERLINFSHNSLEITDKISSTASHSIRIYFLLHPNVVIYDKKLLQRGALLVRIESEKTYTVEDAYWYPSFGEMIPTKALLFSHEGISFEGQIKFKIESRWRTKYNPQKRPSN